MAVTDTGGANAFFSSDLSHLLMTEGNAVADRLGAHFMTSSSSCQQKTAFYTPFFKEVWDKKPEIEQAFNMEEPPGLSRSAECTLEVRPGRRPRPPPRLESYHCKGGSNDGSGSEIYERLPTDASQGDDINLSPSFNDHLLSPSDDSDIYSHVEMYSQENGESLVKPSDIKNAKMHQGWVDDSVFLHRTDGDEGMWMNNYAHRAFTTGRRHVPPTKTRPKGNSHTLKQPGKLNMEEYSLVTDAIARMNVKGKESKLVKLQRPVYGHHAPLAREENMDVVSEYAQVKDAVPSLYSSYDGEYTYALVQDAVGNNKSKVRHRREKGRPAKMKLEGSYGRIHDDESSLDVSSPRDVNSPLFGMGSKLKDDDKLNRRKEKQRAKDDEKLEKKRQKEVKKLAEKEKEREKKKIQKQQQKQQSVTKQLSAGGSSGVGSGGSGGSGASAPTLQDFVQSDDNSVPLLLEKCVKFIEEEGLDSEGIYRVPGNRAHVDLLFQKFEEDSSVDIHELDIPVNAVATALKDFFSKRLPPLFTEEAMTELEDISVRGDRSCRLLALRSLLKKMPDVNFEVLKFVFQHFVRVSENCKLNSMDSKNLAICWWPTLLPIEFSDMGRFEAMRPHLEDVVQTMIDQYPFLFCGKEAFVMV